MCLCMCLCVCVCVTGRHAQGPPDLLRRVLRHFQPLLGRIGFGVLGDLPVAQRRNLFGDPPPLCESNTLVRATVGVVSAAMELPGSFF